MPLRWNNPDADLRVTPKRKPLRKRKQQRRCGCGCGALAGYSPHDSNGKPRGNPRRFIPGHQVSKMSLENKKNENEMAREMAEEEARRLIEEFEAETDALFAEARELGLSGAALIGHVYTVDMEERAVRIQLRRAALEGNREAANWLHGKKYGTGQGGAKGNAVKPVGDTSGYLDPLEVRDSPDDFD